MTDGARLPLIDVGALVAGAGGGERRAVAAQIGRACRDFGFFYIAGHGVDERLPARLEALARRFFAADRETRMAIAMERGGPAWRGYFPVGGELTSGRPDRKEGIYFGAELGDDDPRVRAGTPLHGRNLFPDGIAGFREAVLDYMAALTRLGHRLMEGIALSLGLDERWFADRCTGDPLTLFRVFHYPPDPIDPSIPSAIPSAIPPGAAGDTAWGVGEHTDYGLLTILWQDRSGGLEVRAPSGWLDAPPLPGTFVCNLGDMLDRMTGGRYRSTPHRVRNHSGAGRLSFPFFFDPGWDARVEPVPLDGDVPPDDAAARWDGASVHAFRGTYGDYLLAKVAKVFPTLARRVSDDPSVDQIRAR